MRLTIASVVVAIVVSVGSEVASAQVCNGTANFGRAPIRVTAGAAFSENTSTYQGGLLFGSGGPFGSASVGTTQYDGFDGSSLNLAAGVGYQAALDPAASFGLCLSGSFAYEQGPKDVSGSGLDASATGFSAGLGLGGIAFASSAVKVIPAVNISAIRSTSKLTNQSGNSLSASDTYGILALTMGFSVAGDLLSFGPAVYIPLGLDGGKTAFGVSLEVALGRRATQPQGR